MKKEIVKTDLAPPSRGDYSQAIKVTGGTLIFVSGQVAIDDSGNVLGIDDMAVQIRAVLENLKGVLAGAGAKISDVVKLNIFVTNLAEYNKYGRQIRREYFLSDFPAVTLTEVKSLARPEYLIEIEAIAAV